ncbi:MAG: Holliday junction branch migration protein RuvA [Pegethrix bostrychoides GSE-TBD4-15B]|jgi:Holliday junction DNA helicase RuvA|uniref:Holliday junction branch migration complex subunit RuvA n=1 Tax=Pegethrix bostrychoides GSE-TBD4-15B TaxID=2839662 RepID=A0A951U3A8_9CYAN|nr:Holliday junction branch migration protein RuvA [Pegethrix bostrychoides GSE-TBD4-15B]
MISYLKGTVAAIHKPAAGRVILTLEVNQIGYDLQITPRLLQALSAQAANEPVQIFTHQQVRDDQIVLFGFGSVAERDLFRQLTSVSGVGPQIAMALLDGMSLSDVIQAIVSGNTRMLSRTPGIGAKTAERIALELKNKLVEWRQQSGITTTPDASPAGTVQEEVEITLMALGYSNSEIIQALRAVGQQTALAKTDNAEDWIREAIAWLSR